MTDEQPEHAEDEQTTGLRALGRLTGLASVAGTAALGSLAGCSAEPETDATTNTPTSTDATTASETTTDASTKTTTTKTTTQQTLSAAECREKSEELEAERAEITKKSEALESELPILRRRRENAKEIATLFEPISADVLSKAQSVGIAARDAVVFLESGGLATGWYIDDHHIITNAHNVFDHHGGQTRETVAWTLGGEKYETTLVDFVESLTPDMALLRTEETAPATLQTGSTPTRGSTAPLVQVGHPGGIGNWMISLGRMKGVFQMQTPDGKTYASLETTIPGRQGVSGSPILNLDGEVVGLTNSGLPIRSKEEDEPPVVAEPVVYDRPIASLSYGGHVGIGIVTEYYQDWS